jgi:hypothetical protein
VTRHNRHLTHLRRRKDDLRPQVAQLAREGYVVREIARRLRLSKSTVHDWLNEPEAASDAAPLPSESELLRRQIEHYASIYSQAMAAWEDSRAAREVRLVEETSSDDGSRTKHSIRSENRSGNPALLAKAMDARKRIDDLQERLAGLRRAKLAGQGGAPRHPDDLTEEDLRNMTDAELAALDAHLASGNEPRSGGVRLPPLSDEELSAMSDEQLEAMDIELRRMISQADEPPAASGSEDRAAGE